MNHPPCIRSGLLRPRHGFFGREGGVSTGIYAGLNCGPGSKDAPDAVRENRSRVSAALGGAPDGLRTLHQHHSADVITADADAVWAPENTPKADACVTRTPGLIIGVLTADCAPVLLADAEAGVIGAAHAGWRGALAGVIGNTVAAMAALGAQPSRICAAVGPCIRQPSYQVGEDVFRAFTESDSGAAKHFAPDAEDPAQNTPRWRFDLAGFAAAALRRAGVESVDDTGFDAYTDEARFFSCRRAAHRSEPDYGRMVSAITLTGGA